MEHDDGMNDLREWLADGMKRLDAIRAKLPPSREAPRWIEQPGPADKCAICSKLVAREPRSKASHERGCWTAHWISRGGYCECSKCGISSHHCDSAAHERECWNAAPAAPAEDAATGRPSFLEMQVREAIAVLRDGTAYEKAHVVGILEAGLSAIAPTPARADAEQRLTSVLETLRRLTLFDHENARDQGAELAGENWVALVEYIDALERRAAQREHAGAGEEHAEPNLTGRASASVAIEPEGRPAGPTASTSPSPSTEDAQAGHSTTAPAAEMEACPACRSAGRHRTIQGMHIVECEACGFQVCKCTSKESAVEMWNRRPAPGQAADDPLVRDLVEALDAYGANVSGSWLNVGHWENAGNQRVARALSALYDASRKEQA